MHDLTSLILYLYKILKNIFYELHESGDSDIDIAVQRGVTYAMPSLASILIYQFLGKLKPYFEQSKLEAVHERRFRQGS